MSKRTYNIDGEIYIRADLVKADEVNIEAMATRVLKAVGAVTELDPAVIAGKGRREPLPTARAAAIWLLRDRGLSWSAVGRLLSRNHSTVMSYRSRMDTPEVAAIVVLAHGLLEAE